MKRAMKTRKQRWWERGPLAFSEISVRFIPFSWREQGEEKRKNGTGRESEGAERRRSSTFHHLPPSYLFLSVLCCSLLFAEMEKRGGNNIGEGRDERARDGRESRARERERGQEIHRKREGKERENHIERKWHVPFPFRSRWSKMKAKRIEKKGQTKEGREGKPRLWRLRHVHLHVYSFVITSFLCVFTEHARETRTKEKWLTYSWWFRSGRRDVDHMVRGLL